jgi:hypothetical protein
MHRSIDPMPHALASSQLLPFQHISQVVEMHPVFAARRGNIRAIETQGKAKGFDLDVTA